MAERRRRVQCVSTASLKSNSMPQNLVECAHQVFREKKNIGALQMLESGIHAPKVTRYFVSIRRCLDRSSRQRLLQNLRC